jgi:hypothetical protein
MRKGGHVEVVVGFRSCDLGPLGAGYFLQRKLEKKR